MHSEDRSVESQVERDLRICVVLPGLHRVNRGAETAFEAMASELARTDRCQVTLFGSGDADSTKPYQFVHVGSVRRERFERLPRLPLMRTESVWEELSFLPGLLRKYDPSAFDATITCSYPFTNWFLRSRKVRGYRPAHLYVTQNGDWPCHATNSEYRYFGCDGLVCTNPEFFERNRNRWDCSLIPNGVDPSVFSPGEKERAKFGLPLDMPVVLVVSALIPSKRVIEAIQALSSNESVFLVIAGDGPLRSVVQETGDRFLPGRFKRLSIPRKEMPTLYRCADALLHMSLDEPSANAYTEALSSGLPIVTHDRLVTRWTLQDCGFFCDCTNLESVSAAVNKALLVDKSKTCSEQRELVERRFTWKGIALQYRDAIRRAIMFRSGKNHSKS